MLRKMTNARHVLSEQRVAMLKIDAIVEKISAKCDGLNDLGNGTTIRDLMKLQRDAQNLDDKIQGAFISELLTK